MNAAAKSTRKKLKWIIIVAIIIVIAVFAALSSMKPMAVDATVLENQTVEYKFSEEGIVKSKTNTAVASDVAGVVKNIIAKEGDIVKKGDKLIEMDVEDIGTQIEKKKTERDNIEAQWKQFKEDTERQIAALKSQRDAGYVPRKVKTQLNRQIDILQKNLDEKSESGSKHYYNTLLESADLELRDLQKQMDAAVVKAPIAGVITKIYPETGQSVAKGGSLLDMSDDMSKEIECMVTTSDVGMLKVGMPAVLVWERRDGDMRFDGQITAISTVATEGVNALGLNEQRVKVLIAPSFTKENSPGVGSGLKTEFITDKIENCIAVPKTALFKHEDGDAVWVVQDGVVRAQIIEKSLSTDRVTVITKGLNSGDTVIDNGSLEGLVNGKKVSIK